MFLNLLKVSDRASCFLYPFLITCSK